MAAGHKTQRCLHGGKVEAGQGRVKDGTAIAAVFGCRIAAVWTSAEKKQGRKGEEETGKRLGAHEVVKFL